MYKLKVVLNGEIVFKDCVYAKQENNNVIIKNLSGLTQGFIGVVISEVNMGSKTLTLNKKR